jgi:hypothetical protein
MNTKFTVDHLAVWIADIKDEAKRDAEETIFWFTPTFNKPFGIVAGWSKMFDMNTCYADLFCCSATHPEYVMFIKVVENPDQLTFDFDSLPMPLDKNGEVDDVCIPLERSDDPLYAAQFFLGEWERIMKEHGEVI